MSMARAEQNHGLKSMYSPIIENEQEGQEDDEAAAAASASCCFGFGWRRNQDSRYLLHQQSTERRTEKKEYSSWIVEKIKNLKEFSEILAGPKWKNFVRKVGKYCNPKKSTTTTGGMYSPNSYAMNFDQGPDYGEEGCSFLHSFSSRFSGALYSDPNKDDGLSDFNSNKTQATVKAVVL